VVREEAERLVAAGLAAVSMVAERIGAPTRQRGGAAAAGYDALGDMLFGPAHRRYSVANGSEECCRCPVCRLISAARDPDPDVAEKLATGVGTLAGGAARLARGVAGAVESVWPARPPAGSPVDRPAGAQKVEVRDARPDDDPWAAATAAAAEEPVSPASTALAMPPAATKAVTTPPAARKAVVKKAVVKKAVVKKAVAKKAVKKPVGEPAVGEPAVGEAAVEEAAAEPETRTPPGAAGGDTR